MFEEIAAPRTERPVKYTSTDDNITRRTDVTHCVTVPYTGLPSEVRQADDVCTRDSVTEFMLIILTRATSNVRSDGDSERKMRSAARGANANRAAAQGRDIARVMSIALAAALFAPAISPLWARGEILGTPAAARP